MSYIGTEGPQKSRGFSWQSFVGLDLEGGKKAGKLNIIESPRGDTVRELILNDQGQPNDWMLIEGKAGSESVLWAKGGELNVSLRPGVLTFSYNRFTGGLDSILLGGHGFMGKAAKSCYEAVDDFQTTDKDHQMGRGWGMGIFSIDSCPSVVVGELKDGALVAKMAQNLESSRYGSIGGSSTHELAYCPDGMYGAIYVQVFSNRVELSYVSAETRRRPSVKRLIMVVNKKPFELYDFDKMMQGGVIPTSTDLITLVEKIMPDPKDA